MQVADPLPDLPHLIPKFTMLDRENCLRIHRASCQILHETGVQVYDPEAVALLRGAGVYIEDDTLAKIPPSLAEWALAAAPEAFNLYRRGTNEVAIRLDGHRSYFGPGSDTLRYLDPRTGERRDFFLADVADCARVCDALPEIEFVMSAGIPRDVPVDRYFRNQYSAMVHSTTKPIVIVCNDLGDLEAIAAMAAAIAGGPDALAKYPTLLLYSEPTTPLLHSLEATQKLLFCATNRIPVTHSPAPMMGGTAPITIAGAATLGNAEILSSLVMHQLKSPGAPFLYGHGVHHLDMKEMISVYGAPEFQLARVMAAEMARFYHLPVWGYTGHSDSKVVDAQAAADAQFSALVALLAKTNLNHDVGYLESGLTHSPEMMVLTNEIISQSRRFIQGVRVDDEALAVKVIQEVGPGGEYLSHPHTLSHWRELWLPQIFDRQSLGKWRENGGKSTGDRLKEVTVSILEEHTVALLPDSVIQTLDEILRH
jgi:trimethylamine--corrinoid protein Co-methyltransferase